MADKSDPVEETLAALEPHRRTLYVAGAVLTAVSTIGVFVTWDYPGIFCALAAGAIACDSFATRERARARLTGRLGPCGNLRTGQGSCCCNDSCEPLCGAPLHIYGESSGRPRRCAGRALIGRPLRAKRKVAKACGPHLVRLPAPRITGKATACAGRTPFVSPPSLTTPLPNPLLNHPTTSPHSLTPHTLLTPVGLLITALLFASIFLIAAIATVASLRWNHDFFCAGYTTLEAYRSACPAGGATGRNSSSWGPGSDPWGTDCARWEQCSWLLYSYTISSLSIVVHLVLLTAGGIAMAAYNKMRRIAAGSPLVTMVGTGVCCTPGTLPLPAGFPGGGSSGIGRPDAGAGGAPMTRMNEEA